MASNVCGSCKRTVPNSSPAGLTISNILGRVIARVRLCQTCADSLSNMDLEEMINEFYREATR